MLHEDERSLSKRVPLRFIKRPYAKIDAARTKGRANRLRWEQRKEKLAEQATAVRQRPTAAGKSKSKHAKGATEKVNGKGTKRKHLQQHHDGGNAQPATTATEGISGACASAEAGDAPSRQQTRKRGRHADATPGHASPREPSPPDAAVPTDAKRAAKLARLAKRGVSAQRLAAFAKLGKAPSKPRR